MAKKAHNYKKDIKNALRALVDLPGKATMHLALATSEYGKLEDIDEKTFSELLNNYVSIQESQPAIPEVIDNFNFDDEDEEDLYNG